MTAVGVLLLVVTSLAVAYSAYLLVRPFGQHQSEYFLSHSSHDRFAALAIEVEIERMGKTTWLDDSKLEASVEFRGPVSAGLQRSRYGVLITSEPYGDSYNCREEAELLIRRFRGQQHRLVEVRLEPNRVRDVVPMPRALSCIDASLLPRTCAAWQRIAAEIVKQTEGASTETHSRGSRESTAAHRRPGEQA